MNDSVLFKITKALVLSGLIALVIAIATYAIHGHVNFFNDINNDTIGAFGDFVGGTIGTLFALSATLLIWLTYNSQKAELKQTGDTMRKQRFEDTFFNLLQVQQEIRKSISFDTSNRITRYQNEPNPPNAIIHGDSLFEFAMDDFSRLYISSPGLVVPAILEEQPHPIQVHLEDPVEDIPMNEPVRRIKQKYKKFFDTYHYQLSHYFRHLYNILKFIENNELDEITQNPHDEENIKKKYLFYAGIIQAQMNSAELFLMFYNGICFPHMNRFIRKYNLIENLAKEDLADTNWHQHLYGEGILKTRMHMLQ